MDTVKGALKVTMKENDTRYWINRDVIQGFFAVEEGTVIEAMIAEGEESVPTLKALEVKENALTVAHRYGLSQ